MNVLAGESSKSENKKPKSSSLANDFIDAIKIQSPGLGCNLLSEKGGDGNTLLNKCKLPLGLKNLCKSKLDSDFWTKNKGKAKNSGVIFNSHPDNVMDILDDRMQIFCAISGKHHCKWECENENYSHDESNSSESVEKPKRRRSLSKINSQDVVEDAKITHVDTEKILHGKFKEVDSDSDSGLHPDFNGNTMVVKNSYYDDYTQRFHLGFLSKPSVNSESGPTAENNDQPSTLISLPFKKSHKKNLNLGKNCSAKKICEITSLINTDSDSIENQHKKSSEPCRRSSMEINGRGSNLEEDELSDSSDTSNPFLAAILRTTKKSLTNRNPKSIKNFYCGIKGKFSDDEEVRSGIKTVFEGGKSLLPLNKLKEPCEIFVAGKTLNSAGRKEKEKRVNEKKEFFQNFSRNSFDSNFERKKLSPCSLGQMNEKNSLIEVIPEKELGSKSLIRLKYFLEKQEVQSEVSTNILA